VPGYTISVTYMRQPFCWLASLVHVVAARLGHAAQRRRLDLE
jgi:hypothetical protein